MKTLTILVAATFAAAVMDGCARNANAANEVTSCSPADSVAGQRSALTMGTYAIQFTATEGPRSGRSIAGSLTLRDAPDEWRAHSTPDNTYLATGIATVVLDSIAAVAPGSLVSDDVSSPGVLVMQSPRDGNTILRFGAEANRLNTTRFDGAFMAAHVRNASANRFGGIWASAVGTRGSSGYFCAVRSGS